MTALPKEPDPDSGAEAPPARESWDGATTTIRIGQTVGDVVSSPTGRYLYVSTSGAVKVVNRRHHIVASIPTGLNPARMTMSADGSRLFVTGYDGWLTVIDTATNTGKTVVSERSYANAVSPDGRCVYSTHHGFGGAVTTSWVSIRNADGRFVEAIPVAGCATDVAVNPDGSRVYVGSSMPGAGSGWVAVVDTETFEVVDTVAIRMTADTVTVSPDGSRLYLTHYNGNALSILDLAARAITTLGVHDAPIGVVTTPDATRAYVTGLHSVSLIDANTMKTDGILVGELPRRIHVSHDSARAFVTDFGNQTLWILDTADHSVVATLDIAGHPEALTVTPDGRRAYTTDYRAGTLTAIEMESIVQGH